MKRVILHSDMNACYASIEAKLNPKLKGIPMAVAGNPENRHGIILAKSQEAKVMGVTTGEPIWQAMAKCPDLTIVPPHYEEYLKHSKMSRKIYYDYTNQVEPFGLDECYLDVTGSTHLFGSGEDIAMEIKERVKKEMGITVSVGVSFCKIFAKLGSDMKKPDAITVIDEENFRDKVWPLEVRELVGIGRATERKFHSIGVYTLGELARTDVDILKDLLGINGVYLWQYVNGKDVREVHDRDFCQDIKTIGNSTTCRKDLLNNEEVFNVFQLLSLQVSRRLRDAKLEAGGVEVFVRDSKLCSSHFQRVINLASQSSINIAKEVMELFKEKYDWDLPVRALGIRAINLRKEGTGSQLDVFSDYQKFEKNESCDKAIYEIRKKYGHKAISFASLSLDTKTPKELNEVITLPMSHYNF